MAARPYGVLGRVLGHSYTPTIYRELAGLDYRRFEREPEELEDFLNGDEWEGVNVTIPYKRSVIPYLADMSDIARRLGNVNTITRREDGTLYGDNTDYYGFKCLVESLGVDVAGMRAVVFGGTGGAGATVLAVLADMDVEAISVSRQGKRTYKDLKNLPDIELAVNCTPVGMYPNCPDSPCCLDDLPDLKAVVDIVYNPARTGIILEAEKRNIPCTSGLLMLVAQAAQAVERYTGKAIELARTREVTDRLSATEQNIAIIGMPGCGKTSGGKALSSILDRPFVDIDQELESRLGCSCSTYIQREGEEAFRVQETACLADIAKRSGQVISCGGGVVTRPENYPLLHQNSMIVMIDRTLSQLATHGRPITARDGIEALAAKRMPLYHAWADYVVQSQDTPMHTAAQIRDILPDMI